MTRRRVKPFIKPAVFALIAVAVLACLLPACSWFEGRPPPAPDPDVQAGKLVRLTHTDDIRETNPVWSPRGDRIAFECADYDRGGFWPFSRSGSPAGDGVVRNWPITTWSVPINICVMNADGTGRVQLTDDETDSTEPAWHPNGDKIAFSSYRDRVSSIDVVNADGSGRVRLADGGQPAWSPDGSKIAYSSGGYRANNIYVMNADGSGPRQITRDVFSAEQPAWSPDGSKVAFISFRGREDDSRLYVVDASGSKRARVVISPGSSYSPTWSPDGHRIAYLSRTGDDSSIQLVNADGSERTMLYDSTKSVTAPIWSPAGDRIAFALSLRSDNPELHVINIDGSGLKRLTDRRGRDLNPTWNRTGTKLAFESDRVGHTEIYTTPYF